MTTSKSVLARQRALQINDGIRELRMSVPLDLECCSALIVSMRHTEICDLMSYGVNYYFLAGIARAAICPGAVGVGTLILRDRD